MTVTSLLSAGRNLSLALVFINDLRCPVVGLSCYVVVYERIRYMTEESISLEQSS